VPVNIEMENGIEIIEGVLRFEGLAAVTEDLLSSGM
jgi:hypothetical protein